MAPESAIFRLRHLHLAVHFFEELSGPMISRRQSVMVAEVALPLTKIVALKPTDILRIAVEQMSEKRLGICCVVSEEMMLAGVLTDGDIRRILLREHKPIAALFLADISTYMTPNPKVVNESMSLEYAISLIETADVYDLPVIDTSGHLTGLLHVHSALKYLLSL